MDKIYPPTKIYIASSKIHGLGVFAKKNIKINEIIEETPLYEFDKISTIDNEFLIDYSFAWPKNSNFIEKAVLPWGYGCLYNHSETPNAVWRSNLENKTFEFLAIKNIKKNEEICTFYGKKYWPERKFNKSEYTII